MGRGIECRRHTVGAADLAVAVQLERGVVVFICAVALRTGGADVIVVPPIITFPTITWTTGHGQVGRQDTLG